MTAPIRPDCMVCKHLDRDPDATVFGCAAFPRGIPESIYLSQIKHTSPVDGDNGIVFEPFEDAAK